MQDLEKELLQQKKKLRNKTIIILFLSLSFMAVSLSLLTAKVTSFITTGGW